jgi:hypothetical protein
MLPLFALAPLMGWGMNTFFRNQQQGDAEASASRIRELLGSRPSLMYPGGAGEAGPEEQQGPPQQVPGSGLMADPADPRRQADFMAGIMALRPGERRAAGALFSDIMARAQAGAMRREELGQQREESATREAGINARFDQQHALALKEFDENRRQFGDKFALEKLRSDRDNILKGQEIALNAFKLDALRNPPPASNVQLGPVPSGQYRVTDPQSGQVEDVPVPGSELYNSQSDLMGALTEAKQHIKTLRDLVDEHGTEAYGATAKRMQIRHALATEAMKKIMNASSKGPQTGRYSEAQMEELGKLLTNPTGWNIGGYRSSSSIMAGYDELDKWLEDQYKGAQYRTRNWQGINRAPLSDAAAAQEARYQASRRAPAPPRGAVISGVSP